MKQITLGKVYQTLTKVIEDSQQGEAIYIHTRESEPPLTFRLVQGIPSHQSPEECNIIGLLKFAWADLHINRQSDSIRLFRSKSVAREMRDIMHDKSLTPLQAVKDCINLIEPYIDSYAICTDEGVWSYGAGNEETCTHIIGYEHGISESEVVEIFIGRTDYAEFGELEKVFAIKLNDFQFKQPDIEFDVQQVWKEANDEN